MKKNDLLVRIPPFNRKVQGWSFHEPNGWKIKTFQQFLQTKSPRERELSPKRKQNDIFNHVPPGRKGLSSHREQFRATQGTSSQTFVRKVQRTNIVQIKHSLHHWKALET
jgi:hypothetical protein